VSESFLNGRVTLHRGDCLEVLPTLEECSIDSCVTDPPYHLTSQVATVRSAFPGRYTGTKGQSKGFMGKQWDGGDIAFRPELWAEVFRVLKPGAHLLAFSGTRTYHRMACAIEDAGFEIRDQIGWCYGSGFPKSHDISKAIDRAAGAERKVVARVAGMGKQNPEWNGTAQGRAKNSFEPEYDLTEPATDNAQEWQGWGTALKPAWEPIVLARKPLSESSIAANVLKHGTGAINVDGCRIGTSRDVPASLSKCKTPNGVYGDYGGGDSKELNPNIGRWPANLIHDGSEEVVSGFPNVKTGGPGITKENHNSIAYVGPASSRDRETVGYDDNGSAARFFYTAKADADDRLGSRHPTVKPLDLIQYLVRLVTPARGRVLDPFAGTGTLGEAAFREGMAAILIEREEEYQSDIVKRMGLCLSGPDERRAASVKQVGVDDTPLFGGGV
jgi:DNA modification methylase